MKTRFLNHFRCLVSIEYNFDSPSWVPAAGVWPEWARTALCLGWHSQAPFFIVYPLSVYNHILLASERLVAIRWPFRVAQLARVQVYYT